MRAVSRLASVLVLTVVAISVALDARQAPPAVAAGATLSRTEQEAFLKSAKIVRRQTPGKGVTGTVRATLSDGTLTHDASIQVVDQRLQTFQSNQGVEFNFRDAWQFNVAAYYLDKLLDINMIPATVERDYEGKPGAYTWWVDDVLMDESQRLKKKTDPPNPRQWNDQMFVVRAFDQLIFNTDRNLGNLLISKDWRIWMIDHTRAFRWNTTLRSAGDVARCERRFLAGLKRLDQPTLKREVGRYLGDNEVKGLLARRDLIVTRCEQAGPAALYDAPRF
ncbi:MAG: hypothetical protein AB7I50_06115 [Vicinamibacterales bacterium]